MPDLRSPPHGDAPIVRLAPAGATPARGVIMVHGRGASAESITTLAPSLGLEDAVILAPQASNSTWYPYSFLEPMDRNEPGISSGLALLDRLVRQLEEEHIPLGCIALLGFSQGACLSLEFAVRHPRRYGAIIGFSGGLIGPPGTARSYAGTLVGTPVFVGCSDVDPHIPAERVRETSAVLKRMGAAVDMRLYPGMPHTVNDDELTAARALLDGMQ